jgi:integrase
LLDRYATVKERRNKPGSRTNHRTAANDLTAHFSADASPQDITGEDAEAFLQALRDRGLAPATVARRMCPSNPFHGAKVTAALPREKKHYISPADTERLIAAADPTWRIIVALARYAGLRCPSEVLSLKWEHVNFETGRMTCPMPKLEHLPGKEYMVLPIFAALRPHLDEAWELAANGEQYVVGGPRGAALRSSAAGSGGWNSASLGGRFRNLIRRAGLIPWPRPFNNLRASCETDLLRVFPIQSVTSWMGHSPAVALAHYAQVRDEDFERAAGRGAESGAVVVQKAVQSGAAGSCQKTTEPPESLHGGSLPAARVLSWRTQPRRPIDPAGIRTPVSTLKGSCPRPLDDRASFDASQVLGTASRAVNPVCGRGSDEW